MPFSLSKRVWELGYVGSPRPSFEFLEEIAVNAEREARKYKAIKCRELELFWIGRYMTIKEIVETLEESASNG